MSTKTVKGWIDLSVPGYSKTLGRNGMYFCVGELIQNSWDTDATEVAVTLSKPSNGKSELTCVDNSPKGYADLSQAHILFAESEKKSDPTKRGRFNAGEKQVLCMMDEAEISSTTGTIQFLKGDNGEEIRKESSKGTKVGSSFWGKFSLEPSEYADIVKKVSMVIPPITTIFNGKVIVPKQPIRTFESKLPTEADDACGRLRIVPRKTKVRLYEVQPGETAMLLEMGLPVVEIDCAWHVDVQQRVPLNTERNNVTPAYHKAIAVAVVNEMAEHLDKDEAAEGWVKTATSSDKIKPEAFTKIMETRFGKDAVLEDTVDEGSDNEAASHGVAVVPRGALSAGEKANAKKSEVLPNSSKANGGQYGTKPTLGRNKDIPPKQWTDSMKQYEQFVKTLTPLLINHSIVVRFINEPLANIEGCSNWESCREWLTGIFTVNLAYHSCANAIRNNELLIHELAHCKVDSNNHLHRNFYDEVTRIGAKLTQLALDAPELFEQSAVAIAAD